MCKPTDCSLFVSFSIVQRQVWKGARYILGIDVVRRRRAERRLCNAGAREDKLTSKLCLRDSRSRDDFAVDPGFCHIQSLKDPIRI